MKARESGMPEAATWESFFAPATVVERLGIAGLVGDIVEFGSGYGTFTVAAARATQGTVHALDVDHEMVETVQARVRAAGITNVRVVLRDFMEDGSGLADAIAHYAMLFNILHCERPVQLLREAHRVLVPGGIVGIIHWNYDPSTPRGPSMDIRPRPEQCRAWAESLGFRRVDPGLIDLPPYHYGMRLKKDR